MATALGMIVPVRQRDTKADKSQKGLLNLLLVLSLLGQVEEKV